MRDGADKDIRIEASAISPAKNAVMLTMGSITFAIVKTLYSSDGASSSSA